MAAVEEYSRLLRCVLRDGDCVCVAAAGATPVEALKNVLTHRVVSLIPVEGRSLQREEEVCRGGWRSGGL